MPSCETIVLRREHVAWRGRRAYVYVAAADREVFLKSLLFMEIGLQLFTWIWNAVPQLWMRTEADLIAAEDD